MEGIPGSVALAVHTSPTSDMSHHVPDGTGGRGKHLHAFHTQCFSHPGLLRVSCASWNPFPWHSNPVLEPCAPGINNEDLL